MLTCQLFTHLLELLLQLIHLLLVSLAEGLQPLRVDCLQRRQLSLVLLLLQLQGVSELLISV